MYNTQKHFTDEEEQLYSEVETSMMNYLSEKELKQIDAPPESFINGFLYVSVISLILNRYL